MNAKQLLDPAYAFFLNEPSSEWTLDALAENRRRIHAGIKPAGTGRGEERWTKAASASAGVRLCLYRPTAAVEARPLPTVLYIHGGGFVLGRPEMADDELAQRANELECVIVAVDYRLAPEHPFPMPLDDCYTALAWIFTEGSALGLDTQRVVVMGHSAGGGLAGALALLAHERGAYPLAGLVMVYPMLDYRTGAPDLSPANPTTGKLSWTAEANQFCWSCLRGAYASNDDQIGLFSPSHAPSLAGLPPSFIGVGALDLFLDEDVAFALKLSRAGVPVELHVYPGVPHGFDYYPGAVTDRCRADIADALSRMLA